MNNPMQMNFPIKDTTPVVCEKCGHDIFSEGLKLRKVSKFLVGTEKDGLVPVPVFYCIKCFHVNSDMDLKIE